MDDKVLVDVLNLEGEGLVGFTELGKQVPIMEVEGGGYTEIEGARDLVACLTERECIRVVKVGDGLWKYDFYFRKGPL